jgi:hypothetical protein
MSKTGKIVAVGTVIAGIFGLIWAGTALTKMKKNKGPASFSLKANNLPAGAIGWDCSFQDTVTGDWFAPTNGWVPGDPIPDNDIICFAPSESAQFSIPVSTGILSIFAPGGSGAQDGSAITLPPILASYKITVSVVDGGSYIFDFNIGNMEIKEN